MLPVKMPEMYIAIAIGGQSGKTIPAEADGLDVVGMTIKFVSESVLMNVLQLEFSAGVSSEQESAVGCKVSRV